ncbi:hypothetical protein JTB14_008901 [Gonioctena quinquepunctata]|nr:hypothetical protein JTB14_008901 [Gonioctena quinquepunctata]
MNEIKIMKDSKNYSMIENRKLIGEHINSFFVNIGPVSANKIQDKKIHLDTALQSHEKLSFELTTVDEILQIIIDLETVEASGITILK